MRHLHCADRVGEAIRNTGQGYDCVAGALQLSDGGAVGYLSSILLLNDVEDIGGIDERSDLGSRHVRHDDGKEILGGLSKVVVGVVVVVGF